MGNPSDQHPGHVSSGQAEDWLLRFLEEFASMPESERDAAIDALTPEARAALVSLAEARTATAGTDMIATLDAGQDGLDRLHDVTEPADLLAVIQLAAKEHPNIVVEALFAAVVLYRRGDQQEPTAMLSLRERWHWHVYDQIAATRPQAAAWAAQSRYSSK
jgi:hypothetical protein